MNIEPAASIKMTRRLAEYIVRHPVIAYRWNRSVKALWPTEPTPEAQS